jgi:hypothetical protein
MAGPLEQESAASTTNPSLKAPPPGYFLNADLQSDTARFLAELKASIARREAAHSHASFG